MVLTSWLTCMSLRLYMHLRSERSGMSHPVSDTVIRVQDHFLPNRPPRLPPQQVLCRWPPHYGILEKLSRVTSCTRWWTYTRIGISDTFEEVWGRLCRFFFCAESIRTRINKPQALLERYTLPALSESCKFSRYSPLGSQDPPPLTLMSQVHRRGIGKSLRWTRHGFVYSPSKPGEAIDKYSLSLLKDVSVMKAEYMEM